MVSLSVRSLSVFPEWRTVNTEEPVQTGRAESAPKGSSSTQGDDATPPREVTSALLPERTADESDLVEGYGDDWYRRERPPHHG